MISGNLFTRDYLLEGITRSTPWLTLEDSQVDALRAALRVCADNLLAINKPNEAQTEKVLVYPILELLGWSEPPRVLRRLFGLSQAAIAGSSRPA